MSRGIAPYGILLLLLTAHLATKVAADNPVWDLTVSTLAGSGACGYQDGLPEIAMFNFPHNAFQMQNGNVVVADFDNNRIRMVATDGTVSTLAGSGTAGYLDGLGASAMFNSPEGVAVMQNGSVVVAEWSHRIRLIAPDGTVTTLAGTGVSGSTDGPGNTATFALPSGVDVLPNGSIVIAEYGSHRIRMVSPDGTVSTLTGTTGGSVDGPRATAQLSGPFNVAVMSNGSIVVAEWSGHRIRLVAPDGSITTLAGSGTQGFLDGPAATAQFSSPRGVAVLKSSHHSGYVAVGDQGNHKIRLIGPDGTVSTLVGSSQGIDDGPRLTATFDWPCGVKELANGNIVVADNNNCEIRLLTFVDTPCTILEDCNSHASIVSGTVKTACSCTCSTGYTNATCDGCASNYSGYPSCSAILCTNDTNCNAHASSVSGNVIGGCSCTCVTGYTGAICDRCAANYTNYPSCTPVPCTIIGDCNGHAATVSGDRVAGCNCTCLTNYTHSTCAACAARYSGYPACEMIPCAIPTHCSGHAVSVSGTEVTGCNCTCAAGYTGASCNSCGQHYTGYPSCAPILCTSSAHCHNHSAYVSGTEVSGCRCVCVPGMEGPTCNVTSTLSLSVTGSRSDSHSPSLASPLPTMSMQFTPTCDASQTTTYHTLCGGVGPAVCSSLPGCVLAEDLCTSHACSALTSERICLLEGCSWTNNSCSQRRGCSGSTKESCEEVVGCRWNFLASRCTAENVVCSTLKSESSCVDDDCSWNSLATPKCFRQFKSPSLCATVTDAFSCRIQKCFWAASISRCLPWDTQCSQLYLPSLCELLPKCVYSPAESGCVNLTALPPSFKGIVGVTHPDVVNPNAKFTLRVYGTNSVASVTLARVGSDSSSESLRATATFYDNALKATVYDGISIFTVGSYLLSIRSFETANLVLTSTIRVQVESPRLTRCQTTPAIPYKNSRFQVSFSGALGSTGQFYVVEDATSSSGCPSNASLYHPVRSMDDESATGLYVSSRSGRQRICYVNEAAVPVSCPDLVVVGEEAAWSDVVSIVTELRTNMLAPVDVIINSNVASCQSMQNMNVSRGLFANPHEVEMQFGDGVHSYKAFEVCIFAVVPMVDENVAPDATVTILRLEKFFLDANDVLHVLVPTLKKSVQSRPFLCSRYTTKIDCAMAGCTWSLDSSSCTLRDNPSPEGCLKLFGLYNVVRTISFSEYVLNPRMQIPLPYSGALAVVCTTAGRKTGTGLKMSYTTSATYCPNDCKDATGTSHGTCERTANSWECVCNDAYRGNDCSLLNTCKGVGGTVNTYSAEDFDEVMTSTSDPCAFILRATPPPGQTEGTIGIGVSLSFLAPLPQMDDCPQSHIIIRSGSSKGKLLSEICPTNNGNSFMLLNDASNTLYITYQLAEGVKFRLQFTAVVLACPGKAGAFGEPVTSNEVCDGRGVCVGLNYSAYDALLNVEVLQVLCAVWFFAALWNVRHLWVRLPETTISIVPSSHCLCTQLFRAPRARPLHPECRVRVPQGLLRP